MKAWKTFLASGRRFGLICEDDIRFCPQALAAALKWVIDQENLWDVCSFQLNHRGCPLPLKSLAINSLASKPLPLPTEDWSLCYYIFNVTGAGAYLINAKNDPSLGPYGIFHTSSLQAKTHYWKKNQAHQIKTLNLSPK